jgi:mevalonate kinase
MADPAGLYRGSAAGKVILLGEHAVVYGSAALVVGLDDGAHASVRVAQASELVLGADRYPIAAVAAAEEPLTARAFRTLLAALGAPNVAAEVALAIPAGAGLGASAAIGVALARAVSALISATGSARTSVARAALAWENVFHGNASGVDTAAAEQGGCLSFRRAEAPRPLRPARPLELVIALVEAGASTRRMVEGVAQRRSAERERVDSVLDGIARLVASAEACVARGEQRELGRLMTQNHELLVQLGVSTTRLDQAVHSALTRGALGAKLTGAGGGGCALALVDSECAASVLEGWRELGFACWQKRAG